MSPAPQTRLETLEREVHWLEEVIQRLTTENINLRNEIDSLRAQLSELKKD